MDLFKLFGFFQRHRKGLKVFDIACGLAGLAYGVYAESWLWGASGVLVLLVAWWDPATRISRHMRSRVVTHREN